MRLEGRSALITGAGSGIGRATAELFAAEGARVAVVDVNPQAAQEVADSIGGAIAITADVSSASEITEAVNLAAGTLGGLHVLYNNAGVPAGGTVVDADEDDWDRCFAVNVKGTYLTSRAAVPHLREAGGGSIINQSSVSAQVGIQGLAPYSAAKGAVLSLTRGMAVDFADAGIRVNALCPGTVYTPLMEPLMRSRGDGDVERGIRITATKYPIGRLGTPLEIAQAALFLASEESSFVTGSIFTVDGGMTAW